MTEYLCSFLDRDSVTVEAETRAQAFKKARRKRDEDPVDIQEVADSAPQGSDTERGGGSEVPDDGD